MPRPGCVWSHVLLIDLADLARLPDLSSLLSAFRRPNRNSHDNYTERLVLSGIVNSSQINTEWRPLVMDILTILYCQADLPGFLVAPDSKKYQSLLFAIWSQQWPRLRRNFSFSTGSLADRSLQGLSFDLQVIPRRLRNEIMHETGNRATKGPFLILSDEVRPSPQDAESWLVATADDLFRNSNSEFRDFLKAFGADAENPRGAFRPLAKAFCEEFANKADLKMIGQLFPRPTDALTLKRATVSGAVDRDLWEAFRFLTNESEATAFGRVGLDITKHGARLWRDNRDDLLNTLSQMLEKDWAQKLISAISEILEPHEFARAVEYNRELGMAFVTCKPSLMEQTSSWRISYDLQREIFKTLERSNITPLLWRNVLLAALCAGASAVANDLVMKVAPHAFDAALPWLNDPVSRTTLPSAQWKSALNKAAWQALDSQSLSGRSLLFCSWLLTGQQNQTLSLSQPAVRELVSTPFVDFASALQPYASFLLTTLGLKGTGETALEALGKGFFRCHEILSSGTQSEESWQVLLPELPPVSWWKEWDKCKRLRRATVSWLKGHPHLLGQFELYANSVDDKKLARRIVKTAGRN
jgi:hypothetical protein